MSFEEECLNKHNALRARHGCPPLQLNSKLNAYAKEWATTLAKKNAMQHRPKPKYGENIYFASGLAKVPGDIPAQMWYDEIKKYNFEAATFNPQTGHFTQLIWKDTKEMGVAKVVKDKKTWVVANYTPPGNVVGQFKEQVPPPTS